MYLLRLLLASLGLFAGSFAIGQDGPIDAQIVAAHGESIPDGVEELAQRLVQADVLLLGEVHDNPQGHAARAALLRELQRRAPRPTTLALEHFDLRQQKALDLARERAPDDVAAWIEVASSVNKWPWEYLQPVLTLARDHAWSLSAANLSRSELRAGTADGGARAAALAPMPATALAALREAVRIGHCGMLTSTQIDSIADLQRRRDRSMAAVIENALAPGRRVILLAGNGHVRKDFGVPAYLSPQVTPRMASVGFVERSEANDALSAYDYAVIVAAYPREDPCAGLRDKGVTR